MENIFFVNIRLKKGIDFNLDVPNRDQLTTAEFLCNLAAVSRPCFQKNQTERCVGAIDISKCAYSN